MKTIKLNFFVNGANAGSKEFSFKEGSDLSEQIKDECQEAFGAEAAIDFDESSGSVFIDFSAPETVEL